LKIKNIMKIKKEKLRDLFSLITKEYYIKKAYHKIYGHYLIKRTIQNYKEYLSTTKPKRVLLAYLTEQIILPKNKIAFLLSEYNSFLYLKKIYFLQSNNKIFSPNYFLFYVV